MKIVVLDGYTLNPGDLSWDGICRFGECLVYDRTPPEEVLARAKGADCVLVLTEWDEFKNEELYSGKSVIDGRGVLEPGKAKAICDYQGISW